jgi:GNAT superfamily N-acetyltransferase
MPDVTVRDARSDDAAAIGAVWASAFPYLVRSDARVAADIREDATLGRRRWVGLVDGEVAGTATARQVSEEEVFLAVEVRDDLGSRGVGSALMATLLPAVAEVPLLTSISRHDPISLAFGIRHGFLPVGEHRVARVDPRSVPTAGPAPAGLDPVSLDAVDLDALLDTHNTAADDDPSGMTHHYTMEAFRAEWWNSPDNAPELSWALVEPGTGRVAGFTSVQVDRPRARAWSSMTATRPEHRGHGLATWLKTRSLNALAAAGVGDAWTANDSTNEAMIAVNDRLGYRPTETSVRIQRRLLPH